VQSGYCQKSMSTRPSTPVGSPRNIRVNSSAAKVMREASGERVTLHRVAVPRRDRCHRQRRSRSRALQHRSDRQVCLHYIPSTEGPNRTARGARRRDDMVQAVLRSHPSGQRFVALARPVPGNRAQGGHASKPRLQALVPVRNVKGRAARQPRLLRRRIEFATSVGRTQTACALVWPSKRICEPFVLSQIVADRDHPQLCVPSCRSSDQPHLPCNRAARRPHPCISPGHQGRRLLWFRDCHHSSSWRRH